jgi:O-succinylbenzoic acid--CoA ligase
MPHPYTRLTINNETFTDDVLVSFALSKLASFDTESWEYGIYSFIVDWISDKETMIVQTSGSTGEPRKMEIEKAKMIKSAIMTASFFNYSAGNKALLCLPADFIAGKMMIVRAFVSGLNLRPVKPSTDPIPDDMDSCDFAALTPMQVHQILKSQNGYEKLNQIEQLIIGGGDIDSVLLQKIRTLNNNSYHSYGMTETLTHIALKRLNGREPDAYFKAMDGVHLETDHRNCLVIYAPHLSVDPIITNDVVDLKSIKEFEFKGRIDHVINSGGVKLLPEQIEEKLKPYIISAFVIVGIPNQELGEIVALIIEGPEIPNIKETLNKAPLSKFEKPKQIRFIEKLPRTRSGKIKRSVEI